MNKISNYLIYLLGAALFVPLFIFRQIGPIDFWWWMSLNLVLLMTLVLFTDPSYKSLVRNDIRNNPARKILIGLASAVALYFVFFAGNYLSRLMFDFAGQGIEGVYEFKGGAAKTRILLLMMLIIGPGEELFWRGFVQRNFEDKLGKWKGFLLAVVFYTGVHIFSGNPMLILAALVAGLFWGWMFMRYRSLTMNIVSHTVWDIAVFLVVPFS